MGASNLAAKRAAKANRRKAIVAQKRRTEAILATPAGQVAHAAALPIRCCMLTANVFEIGTGTLILARGGTVGPVIMGAFLLDTFCRGVKDVTVRSMGTEELDAYLHMLEQAAPLVSLDPSHGRKLLRDLVRWSGSMGFPPAREFPMVERLFGTVDVQACQTEFAFGRDGKPLYMSGPGQKLSEVRDHIALLAGQLGQENFDYAVAVPAD